MSSSAICLATLVGLGLAVPVSIESRQYALTPYTGGSGPYPAFNTSDPSLPAHTIYRPINTPVGVKLPVLVWGNGGCFGDGLMFAPFLTNVASYGFIAISSGAPGGTGGTQPAQIAQSVDWISHLAGSGDYSTVDASRIAAAGQSCGGLEAYTLYNDSRVDVIGIFNSGILGNADDIKLVKQPVFYFLGGSTDIAYANGERDYKGLTAGIPAWKGNQPTGHEGTYMAKDAGAFGAAAVKWLQYTLQANSTAADWFTGSGAKNDGWDVEFKNLDKLNIT